MKVHRALGHCLLALALAVPLTAAAQTAPRDPTSVAALTNDYFEALLRGDAAAVAHTTTGTFHVIQADGKRLSYPDFIGLVMELYFQAQQPMGIDVKIKASNETGNSTIETVDTLRWFFGGMNNDPIRTPTTQRDFATHQLTWIKSADGRWLLDEDHITSFFNT